MMTIKEYMREIKKKAIDHNKVARMQKVYEGDFPEIVEKIISDCEEAVFLDEDIRVLSFDEIINAKQELHVDFQNQQMIPIMDCGENDFVVYHFKDGIWSKFNIVDETVFKKKNSLEEMFKIS